MLADIHGKNIQYHADFAEGCLYVAVKPEKKTTTFSGKYYFHSLYNNVGAYIREPGLVSGYSSKQFFLVYETLHETWYITNDDKNGWDQQVSGGCFRISSKGRSHFLDLI